MHDMPVHFSSIRLHVIFWVDCGAFLNVYRLVSFYELEI